MIPGTLVRIVGDSVFGFSDRYGDIARVKEIKDNMVVVESRDGSMADLYPLSSVVAC